MGAAEMAVPRINVVAAALSQSRKFNHRKGQGYGLADWKK
jgi:hypothetical protein